MLSRNNCIICSLLSISPAFTFWCRILSRSLYSILSFFIFVLSWTVRAFAGSFGSLKLYIRFCRLCHVSTLGKSALCKYGVNALFFSSSIFGMQKLSSNRPLSVCSTQRILYFPCILGNSISSNSCISLYFIRSSIFSSSNDKQPTSTFCLCGLFKMKSLVIFGSPCSTFAVPFFTLLLLKRYLIAPTLPPWVGGLKNLTTIIYKPF